MNIQFEQSFLKSLDKLADVHIKLKVAQIIHQAESSAKLTDIKQLKKCWVTRPITASKPAIIGLVWN